VCAQPGGQRVIRGGPVSGLAHGDELLGQRLGSQLMAATTPEEAIKAVLEAVLAMLSDAGVTVEPSFPSCGKLGRIMSGAVVVSNIGAALRRHGMRVSDLQRRLERRGVKVSRTTLDRLTASDRPLVSVNFAVLVPVLEELNLTLGDSLAVVPEADVARTLADQRTARAAVRTLGVGESAQASGAKDRMAELRRRHPEAFDARGRLRKRELTAAVLADLGTEHLSRNQVLNVIERRRRADGEHGAHQET
jgi:hypothetical protein